ncbi:MAG: hypothetical protein IPL49_05710 [Saprospirales bacterium]|nr:hypothetical protein [Saprospirales bacterium]MBK8490404.1 hypothetical protein [Saprospirales bacterium]
MYHTLFISPMIPSFRLAETGEFFCKVLGFTTVMDTAEYGIYEKNNLTVHILPAGEDIGQMEFYMEVDNVDELWITIKDNLKGLKVREPFDRDYGMREIHIEIPQTNTLLFIGQAIHS